MTFLDIANKVVGCNNIGDMPVHGVDAQWFVDQFQEVIKLDPAAAQWDEHKIYCAMCSLYLLDPEDLVAGRCRAGSTPAPGITPSGDGYRTTTQLMTTYQQLREYFTEQELDDAAVIARHSQNHFPGNTYAEIFIKVLIQMRLHPTASGSVKAGDQVQTLVQLLPPAEIGTAHIDTPVDLTTGWTKHPAIPSGYYLAYSDEWIQEISIVTGPRGSGLMASNNPGFETTYEVWFPGLDDPTGHLTLDEVKGIIKFLRQQAQEAHRYSGSVKAGGQVRTLSQLLPSTEDGYLLKGFARILHSCGK